jgi:hypothetical protein
VPDRARVTPTQGHHLRPARGSARRRARSVPARAGRPDGRIPGPFEVGATSKRLTLIEFTWNQDGRIQPVLYVGRELLD